MSDSPLTATPTPPWGHTPGAGHGADPDIVERLRSRLLRIALVSVVIVAVLGVAGVLAIAAAGSWATLISVFVVVACVLVVLIGATRAAAATRALGQLHWATAPAPLPVPVPALVETLQPTLGDDPEQRREVFGKLARRLQSLINRAIKKVDALEREIEDPDLLRGLYEIDHLATRVRRQAENLAVLGGEAPQRRSSVPVSAYAVLRSAVAEIEHYKQISIVAIEDVYLHGHAVAEIIHLLAELLENATTFTAPDTGKVVLRAQKVTAGLAIEVQDRGLGMTVEDLQRINRLLDGTTRIDIEELLKDGRIGMAVVKELARRHNVRVRLQTNIFGGIDAFIVLPHNLLSDRLQEPAVDRRPQPTPRETPEETTLTPGQLSPVSAADQPQTTRHGRAIEAAPVQEGTALPVREPGITFAAASPAPATPSPSPSAPINDVGSFVAVDQPSRPPLPQRRGQSHLRQELLEPPVPTRPLPGHNTNLMASVQQGFDRGRAELSAAAEQAQPQHGTTQGESVPHGR
jgi:signal transduction histidine kinase